MAILDFDLSSVNWQVLGTVNVLYGDCMEDHSKLGRLGSQSRICCVPIHFAFKVIRFLFCIAPDVDVPAGQFVDAPHRWDVEGLAASCVMRLGGLLDCQLDSFCDGGGSLLSSSF